MKFAIAFACMLIGVFAVEKDNTQVPIVSQESNVDAEGNFHYHYETGDGTKANQDGHLKTIDPEHAGEAVEGGYTYTSDDGQVISLKYTADERGFIPQGDHIPTSPPIPAAIARALEILATAPPPKEE